MLQTLTAQLLQNKQLHIPHVGSFNMQQHSAVLNFAERLIHPPYAEITFKSQTDFNHTALSDIDAVDLSNEEIEQFGLGLRKSLSASPFYWTGLGTFELENEQVVFQPESLATLTPVPANKVIRENREHAILVGDQERSSADTSFINESSVKSRNWLWIGWVLVLLAALAITWHLYKEGSFGSKTRSSTAVSQFLTQSSYS